MELYLKPCAEGGGRDYRDVLFVWREQSFREVTMQEHGMSAEIPAHEPYRTH